MYELIRARSARMVLAREMAAGIAALVIAEVFYKFGSFSLECLAFLVTWYAFGMVLSLVWGRSGDGATQR